MNQVQQSVGYSAEWVRDVGRNRQKAKLELCLLCFLVCFYVVCVHGCFFFDMFLSDRTWFLLVTLFTVCVCINPLILGMLHMKWCFLWAVCRRASLGRASLSLCLTMPSSSATSPATGVPTHCSPTSLRISVRSSSLTLHQWVSIKTIQVCVQ